MEAERYPPRHQQWASAPLERSESQRTPHILVEYETRPGVTVENPQQVRVVYDRAKGRWKLQLACKHEAETPDAPGNETAGIDLYPGNRLKQDQYGYGYGYYFPKEIANCDDSGGEKATRLHAKWSEPTFCTPWRHTSLSDVLRTVLGVACTCVRNTMMRSTLT